MAAAYESECKPEILHRSSLQSGAFYNCPMHSQIRICDRKHLAAPKHFFTA